jgi:hypothetical protein
VQEKKLIKALLLAFVLLVCLGSSLPAADVKGADTGEILSAAESVFQNMKKGDYPALWSGLTAETQRSIIRNTGKALEKAGLDYSGERIRKDCEAGGEIARGYWRGYLSQFDPATVLEQSAWNIGAIKGDRAAIIIRYKKSSNDAIIHMFREGGVWKVGLEETFATRTK